MTGAPQFPDPLGVREVVRPGATAHKAGMDPMRRVQALEQGAAGRPGPGVADGSVQLADSAQVGGVVWTAKPTLTGVAYTAPWADFGSGYRGFYYTKDRDGFVTVAGMAKRVGTSSVGQVFTLPAGFRPGATLLIPGATSVGLVNLEIAASGVATTGMGSGTNSYVAFTTTFFAEA